jgi:hypothetical protein
LGAIDAAAQNYSSASFTVKNPVIVIGGGFSTSASFQLQGSIGQPAIGTSSANSFSVNAGFLFFPAPSVSPSPGVSPSPAIPRRAVTVGIVRIRPACFNIGDFNCDGRVGIADLSIFLYWMAKPLADARDYDINNDGALNIIDISIMFYYWTAP